MKSVWQEWIEGLRLIRSNRMLIAIFVSVGIASYGDAILVVLLIPFVNTLHGGVIILGWLLTIRGLGGLLGGLVAGKVGSLLRPILVFSLGLCTVGLIDLIMVNSTFLSLVMICLFLLGIVFVIFDVNALTLFQSSVADQFRGRVFGTWGTISSFLIILGQVSGSTLGGRVGIIPMLNVTGTLYIVSGLVAFLMISRTIAEKAVPKNIHA